MTSKNLRQHLLRLISGTLLVLVAAIMVAVWLATNTFVREKVQQDLKVGREVLQQLLQTRQQLLLGSAEVLTADFGFKQAVASQDSATIESALLNHGARINADLMALVSLQGFTVASSSAALQVQQRFPNTTVLDQALLDGNQTAFIALEQDLYQIMVIPVRIPIPVGIAVIGFRLNQALADEMKQLTSLDVSFVSEQNGAAPLTISTLPPDQQMQALQQQTADSTLRLPFLDKAPYRTEALPLTGANPVTIYLSASLASAYGGFDVLQLEILTIAIIALCATLIAGMVFSRKLTDPLQALANLADDIATGYYRRIDTVDRNVTEIGQLLSAFNRMQEDLSEREARITHNARHDSLTGLVNRERAIELIDIAIQKQLQPSLQIIVLNVSGFRVVNDSFGHWVGDQCLRMISERLLHIAHDFQLTARLVGDEFLLVLPAPEHCDITPDQVQQMLKAPYAVQDLDVTLDFVLGVALWPADANSAADLIQKASIALDMARRSHLAVAHYERKVEEMHRQRLTLLADLKQALAADDGQLRMYYQPKVCARTLNTNRFEALIRWIHPQQGFIPPDKFIPLAEQAGLINNLTDWIVEAVIKQISLWQQQSFQAQVAVNLSAQDLSRTNLLDHINRLLQLYGVTPDAVSFEITESEVMRDADKAIALLNTFRTQGFKLAIDDFGTGYSSLSQLKNMPVTELKIDRSFVMQLDKMEDDQIIVRSTIDLAHSFELEIVAEGVENAIALNLLQQWGVDWVQGYHFSRPLPAADVLPWVQSFSQQVVQAQSS